MQVKSWPGKHPSYIATQTGCCVTKWPKGLYQTSLYRPFPWRVGSGNVYTSRQVLCNKYVINCHCDLCQTQKDGLVVRNVLARRTNVNIITSSDIERVHFHCIRSSLSTSCTGT